MRSAFNISSGVALAASGLAKVVSVFGGSEALHLPDPIIGIKFSTLMLAVGIAETVIAMVCFLSKAQTLALELVAWLATSVLIYRVGLWWIGWKKPCTCLGNLTDALHIPPQVADNIMKAVLGYLLIGSYALLIMKLRNQRFADLSRATAKA